MKIGKIVLKSNLILPAIAGYADPGFRMLCHRFGAALTCTGMISAKGLMYGNKKSGLLLATHESEDIKVVQLFGNDASIIASAIESRELEKFDIIDLNFGCPMRKIISNGDGSAIMNDSKALFTIINAAVVAAKDRPITVKMRSGPSRNNRNVVELARIAEEAGASAITVHGRTVEDLYSGNSDNEIIADVKKAIKIPVIGNGDVKDRESCLKMINDTGVDGVAIARAAIGAPYVFQEIMGERPDINISELIKEHFNQLVSIFPESVAVNNIKKHILAYLKHIPNSKQLKVSVCKIESSQEFNTQINLLERILEEQKSFQKH
ncbi:MAG: tRNA-dihydrouridine synthase [Christensenellaceae bacterium]|jgi:nifR3 family TIM-barrel protein|nr:tRNA-dihydrouridine synthase [Christensenellaceae bacterium]